MDCNVVSNMVGFFPIPIGSKLLRRSFDSNKNTNTIVKICHGTFWGQVWKHACFSLRRSHRTGFVFEVFLTPERQSFLYGCVLFIWFQSNTTRTTVVPFRGSDSHKKTRDPNLVLAPTPSDILVHECRPWTRSPSSALLYRFFFGWEGSPTQIDYRKKGNNKNKHNRVPLF